MNISTSHVRGEDKPNIYMSQAWARREMFSTLYASDIAKH